jgi:sarcosine oxidase subunit gamma
VTVDLSRLRRSPLAHRAADLAAASSIAVTMGELPFLTMVNLRVLPESAAAQRIGASLRVGLPGPGGVAAAGGGWSVLWLGPDEWLVVGPNRAGRPVDADGDEDLVLRLDAALAGDAGSVVDVSANRTTLELTGASARDLLEKGCTLDLHPRAFTVGRCAQTTLARGQLLIWQTHHAARQAPGPAGRHPPTPDPQARGDVYRLMFRGSFADYFADWLIDAAAEFGATHA